MRKTHRRAVLAAMAVLVSTLTACGGGSTAAPAAPTATAAPATSAPAAASDGVTTGDQLFGPACGGLPQGTEPGSPVGTAVGADPALKAFAAALGAAELGEALDAQRAVTVFAPYDGAFAEVQRTMGAERFGALLKDTATLSSILALHVVGDRHDADGIVGARALRSLAGPELTIGGTPAAPTVTDPAGNTARVLCGNIPTANATVFVIDKVLQPTV